MNSESPICPQCGCALPADAPQGLCPRCLAALNFATETLPADALPVALQEPMTPEELAPHFPQLEILDCLGRGGMGVVYKARQKSLNRLVALKLLAPERAGDAKFAARFEKEAQALAALSHPHIVTIHDFGQAGGFYFLLMEFVDGVNLRQAMSAGRFTPEQALAIIPPVCEALQYAHEHGIVHRDIKPENLLLDRAGRVKIADFGIAKMLGAAQPDLADAKDAAGSRSHPLGTPAYAAPEQQNDPRHVDHRADIYSLGVVLYELLTGELPKGNIGLPTRRVQIDVRLEEVVLRALEVRPELRFSTVAEFQTRLAGATAKPVLKAPMPEPRPVPVPYVPGRKWPGVLALVLGQVLLLGATLLNEIVDDFGLTANARLHLERREQAQQEATLAKADVVAKNAALVRAKNEHRWRDIPRLTSESEAASLRSRTATLAIESAADFKQADEAHRVAIFYLIAGGLIAAGCVLLVFRRHGMNVGAGAKQYDRRKALAGVVFAWVLAIAFTVVLWEVERLEKLRGLEAKKESFKRALGDEDPNVLSVDEQIAALGGSTGSNSSEPPKEPTEPKAPASSEVTKIRTKILQLQREKDELSATLGRKHPRILLLTAQILGLEEQLAKLDPPSLPGQMGTLPKDPRFITRTGIFPLNKRYTLHVDPKALRGKGGGSMRSYSLRSSVDDGTAGVATFAPLAIENELFLIYWDRQHNELWLASPSILRWHHLPESGDPEDQVFIQPEIPADFAARLPEVFAEAIQKWDLSNTRLTEFLRGPHHGTLTVRATLVRHHYFANDVPQGLECLMRIDGDEKHPVFVKRGSELDQKLRKELSWDESRPFLVTLMWQQEGSQHWLEILRAEPTAPAEKK